MSANSWGYLFKLVSFGESHGPALGVVIEGCPAGLELDEDLLHRWMERRRPGGKSVSGRRERDRLQILSGLFEGKTLGTPIAVVVANEDSRSEDYKEIQDHHRIGHADDVWQDKFGHRDHRGGGRASGRETLARVIGGAFAQMLVQKICPRVKVCGRLIQVGDRVEDGRGESGREALESFLLKAKEEGESYGAMVEIQIQSPPRGLGQPVFRKLKSDLAQAMMSVGATGAFEIGEGRDAAFSKGTEFHQEMNHSRYGGIRGGLSTGETISFRVCFKPTSSLLDVAKKGRHDPCVALRALPVLEAMAYIVLADHLLWTRLDRVEIHSSY